MRKISFILLLVSIPFVQYAQVNFEKLIAKNNELRAYNVLELQNNSFIICGTESPANDFSYGYIALLDSLGNIINQKTFVDSSGDVLFLNLVRDADKIIVVGTKDSLGKSNILLLNIDYSLDIVSQKEVDLNIQNANSISYFTTILNSDSNFLITGSYLDPSKILPRPFLACIDRNGSVLSEKYNGFIDSTFFAYNSIEINNQYKVLVSGFGNGGNQILTFDKNLNFISKYIIPGAYPKIANIKRSLIDSVLYYVGSTRLQFQNKEDVYAIKYDSLFNLLDSNIISYADTLEINSFFNCLSVTNNSVYSGSTSNIDVNYAYYGTGTSRSSFFVNRFDNNLNLLWTKKYFYTNSYLLLLDIYATLDGGCIMLGTRRDNSSSFEKNDILIIKVDSNGNTTWTQNISQPEVKLRLYPNPVANQLNLQLRSQNQSITSIQFFDIQGKEVLNKQSNSAEIILDVSGLSSGVYLIKGKTNTGLGFSRKFVKE